MSPEVNLAVGPTAAAFLSIAVAAALLYFDLRVRPLLVEALKIYKQREAAAEAQVRATESLASSVHKLAGRAAA